MKNCKQCKSSFEIINADLDFYKRIDVPEPTLCPDCRSRRRMSWRNERNLYKRKCDLCGKQIIAMYAPDTPYIVYCRDCWWSDKWNALEYGREFDFSKTFFEQFNELLKVTPKANMLIFNAVENCEYCNYQNDSRNCYLTFGSGFMENCLYTDWVYYAKNVIDCSFCQNAELDYMNVDCTNTYHCQFCQNCKVCNDCFHCYDMRNCKNCFGCVGLRNKEYHLFNKPLPEKEYKKTLQKLKQPGYKERIKEEVQKLKLDHPHLFSQIINSENCTGDDIENSKNCKMCFNIKDSEDCKFNFDVLDNKDVMDANRTGISEMGYELSCGGFYQQCKFDCSGAYISFAAYTFECMNSKHLFGCVGINHQDYVIFNKKYSREEFEKLSNRISEHMKQTGEWGEFFPASISPFAYNETVANEFLPLTKEQCHELGFRWRDPDKKEYQPQTYQVPKDIKDVPDSITDEILACEVTGKNFKITPQELKFYRGEELPIPTKCPNQRYLERLALKNPRKLWDRKCEKCKKPIQTTYSPDRPEKVYCEQCYLKTVY